MIMLVIGVESLRKGGADGCQDTLLSDAPNLWLYLWYIYRLYRLMLICYGFHAGKHTPYMEHSLDFEDSCYLQLKIEIFNHMIRRNL